MNPVHRIEPRLLTVPNLYGSAGEPSLDTMPNPSMPSMSQLQPSQGPSMGGMIPLAALAAMFRGGQAQAPQIPLSQISQPNEQPNDEPLDVMSDDMTFKQAFAKARKLGLEVFTWRGKPYTTKLKSE